MPFSSIVHEHATPPCSRLISFAEGSEEAGARGEGNKEAVLKVHAYFKLFWFGDTHRLELVGAANSTSEGHRVISPCIKTFGKIV